MRHPSDGVDAMRATWLRGCAAWQAEDAEIYAAAREALERGDLGTADMLQRMAARHSSATRHRCNALIEACRA